MFNRPTDASFDPQGNIFVADGYINSRIAKRQERPLHQAGRQSRITGPQFTLIHAIEVDAKGNVYAGSRSDARIVVFDNDLNYKTIAITSALRGRCVSLRARISTLRL